MAKTVHWGMIGKILMNREFVKTGDSGMAPVAQNFKLDKLGRRRRVGVEQKCLAGRPVDGELDAFFHLSDSECYLARRRSYAEGDKIQYSHFI